MEGIEPRPSLELGRGLEPLTLGLEPLLGIEPRTYSLQDCCCYQLSYSGVRADGGNRTHNYLITNQVLYH